MKKIFIFFVSLLAVLFIGIAAMFFYKFCPPQGPWPSPPWCQGNDYVSYEYKDLNYIKEEFEPTDKPLDFLIGTFDIWGNPHIFIDLGENSKNHVDDTMKKLNEIGSEGLFLTDFASIGDDLSINLGTKGAGTMTQSEMDTVVAKAKQNQQNKVILIVNLYDPQAAIRRFKGESMHGTVGEKLLQGQSADEWQKIFSSWGKFIVQEAKKADEAGVDYFIVSPGDFVFTNYKNKRQLNKAYIDFIAKTKENFKGKIGLLVYYSDLSDLDDEVLRKIDFAVISWDPNGDAVIRDIFSDISEDVDAIEASFTKWLSLPSWQKLKNKEVYLSVTMPSYDGALQKGWIEPGAEYGPEYKKDFKEQALAYEGLFRSLYNNDFGIRGVISYGYWWTDRIYPEVKVLRNDLSHSIRNKDAENVFYKWSKIFK